ncbi:hypothetical protein NT04LM_1323, partial [Listeria monocytogenes FSL F2-208]
MIAATSPKTPSATKLKAVNAATTKPKKKKGIKYLADI